MGSVEEENQYICEKLLGWEPWQEPGEPLRWKQRRGESWWICDTPTFFTGNDMLLILEAVANLHLAKFPASTFNRITIDWDRTKHPSLPAAVRASALGLPGID